MGWSFKVGRLAGIDIFVHFTFLLLLGWIAVAGFMATGSVAVAVMSLLLVSAVFVIVVLHELGHALAARYYGIPTRDITLLPIGGVARLERMPDKPVQELVVALAGPAVNVVLAGIFFAIGLFLGLGDPESGLSFGGSIVHQLFMINIFLAGFNMLPAFPMDGGRVLRALLAMQLGPTRATSVATQVGKGMAIVFAIVGLFGVPFLDEPRFLAESNLMLVLIAVFVWIGAGEERRAVQARAGLAGAPVSAIMVHRFAAVEPDDRLEGVARYVQQGYQQDFPVVVGERVVGLLTRNDLMYGLSEFGPDARVLQVMRRDFPTVSPHEPAESGLGLMSEDRPIVPVLDRGRLVGLLTAENLMRYMWMRRRDLPTGSGRGTEVASRA
jgi:Zn-dependent protease